MRSGAILMHAAAASGLLLAAAAGDEPPKLERTIPLEGVQGALDHMALSGDGKRLAVAALANGTVEIVDVAQGRAVRRIEGIPMPTGGAFVDGDRQIAIASADDGKLHFFDARTCERIRSVEVGPDADPVRVDDEWRCIWVGVGEGALVAVEKGAKWFEIPLRGHPAGFQLESKGARIFVNVPDAGHVAVLDRKERKTVATWALKGAADNYPMALDEANGRVLVGCRRPPRLLVLDTKDGGVKASVEISGDVDDLFPDPKARLVYASCGEGFVDVIAERGGDRYERVARVPTSPGARTSLLDPERARLFVACPGQGGKPAGIRVYRTPSK